MGRKIELPADYGKPKRKGGRQKNIVFGPMLEDSVFNLVRLHNEKFPNNKVALDYAKRVVKRSIDLCSDSEVALTRLRNFLSAVVGKNVERYTDDQDLLKKLQKK